MARRRARSGRGRTSAGPPGCASSRACRARRRSAPAPSARRGAPSSPSGRASIESVRIVLMQSSSSCASPSAVRHSAPRRVGSAVSPGRVPSSCAASTPGADHARRRRRRWASATSTRRHSAGSAREPASRDGACRGTGRPRARARRRSPRARARRRSRSPRSPRRGCARSARTARSASASPSLGGVTSVAARHAGRRGRAGREALSGLSRASSVASRSSAWPLQSASRQPRFGQLPGQAGPSGSIVKWPSSAPSPWAPRKIRPSIDHAAADAGAEREHHEVGRIADAAGPRRARRSWRRCRRTPARRSAAELLAQRHARERDVHARQRPCRSRSRSATARRRRSPRRSPAGRDQLAHRALDPVEQRLVEDSSVGCWRCCVTSAPPRPRRRPWSRRRPRRARAVGRPRAHSYSGGAPEASPTPTRPRRRSAEAAPVRVTELRDGRARVGSERDEGRNRPRRHQDPGGRGGRHPRGASPRPATPPLKGGPPDVVARMVEAVRESAERRASRPPTWRAWAWARPARSTPTRASWPRRATCPAGTSRFPMGPALGDGARAPGCGSATT